MLSLKPVLLVEDDDLDAMIIQRCFRDLAIDNDVVRQRNGEEALAYLRGYPSPMPCVILLDLNMPRMDGFEFLRHVKADLLLRVVPVLMLTTSAAEEDIKMSFELGAVDYIIKSPSARESLQDLRRIESYCHLECESPAVHFSSHSPGLPAASMRPVAGRRRTREAFRMSHAIRRIFWVFGMGNDRLSPIRGACP